MRLFKNIIIILLLIGSAVIILNLNLGKLVNITNDKNIRWSPEWEISKVNDKYLKTTIYPGSEFNFTFKNSKSLSFRVLVDEDLKQEETLKVILDDKVFLFRNPNISSKKLTILINKEEVINQHKLKATYYCSGMVSRCKVSIEEIILEGGSIIPSEHQTRKTLGVIGDSISLMYGQNNYSSILSEMLGFHLHNASYWGSTMVGEGGTHSIKYRYKEEIIKYKPDLIIIFLGANELTFLLPLGIFDQDYEFLVTGIKRLLPKSKIFLIGILPRKSVNGEEERIKYNNTIEAMAKKNKIDYLDSSGWLISEDYIDDIHPNAKGQEKIAKQIFTSLQKNKVME